MKQLRNFTEGAVELILDRYFQEAEVCHCDICRLDVTAIMLNNLKQKYVVTDKGELYAQLDDFDPQYKVDFITIMSQAAKIVNKSPRH
ncbi:MAG: late competence development ComFB family protein [Oscillospiraceae bacterium]|nr:late competence development ComFB family protein [Oscillospiraceae bacterium]MCL2278927.1 late competence development ComFB family protein [Oscillospiraceae bacterium]